MEENRYYIYCHEIKHGWIVAGITKPIIEFTGLYSVRTKKEWAYFWSTWRTYEYTFNGKEPYCNSFEEAKRVLLARVFTQI